VVAEPEPIRVDPRWRVEPFDAHVLQPLREPLDIVLKSAERDIAELLARPFADRSPDVGLSEGAERQTVAALTDIEAEFAIKILRDGEIRHREVEMIHRMNAKLTRAAARLDVTVNRRHRASSLVICGQATAKPRLPAIRFNPPENIFVNGK
jgi:hypothetical protein